MAIPLPKVFWPLIIDATNNKVYWREGGATERTATIASATYYSAKDFFDAIITAMNASATGTTFAHTFPDGILTITATLGPAWRFSWGVSVVNAAYILMGYFATNTADAVTQAAPYQHSNGWYSPVAVFDDSKPRYEVPNGAVLLTMGGQSAMFEENELNYREVQFKYLSPERTYQYKEGSSSNINRAIERWWRSGRARFRYWEDASVEGTYEDYSFDFVTIVENGFKPVRMYRGKEVYELGAFGMRKWVAP